MGVEKSTLEDRPERIRPAPQKELPRAPRKPELHRAEQHPPAPPRKSVGHHLEELRRIILNVAFLALVGLFVWTAGLLLTASDMVVEPLGLPKTIKDLGYTEDASALSLRDNIIRITKEAQSGNAAFAIKTRLEEQDIDVPVADLSITSLIRVLRQVFGLPQKRIVGDIVCISDSCNTRTLELRLRLTDGVGPSVALPAIKAETPDALLGAGAETVLRQANPLSLALYLYGDNSSPHPRRDEAVTVAKEMVDANHADSAMALNLLGIELIDRPTNYVADLNLAIAYLEAATKLKPDLGLPYLNWGLALRKLGRPEEALEKATRSTALLTDVPTAFINLGAVQADLKQYDAAQQSYDRALALSPDDPDVLNAMGSLLVNRGDPKGAVEKLQSAIKLRPEFAFAQFNMGLAYRALSDNAAAIAAFQEYLRLIPDASDKDMVEGWIAELKK